MRHNMAKTTDIAITRERHTDAMGTTRRFAMAGRKQKESPRGRIKKLRIARVSAMRHEFDFSSVFFIASMRMLPSCEVRA